MSIGPQSEIDLWEQIDYRDERRRQRSNSAESNHSVSDIGNQMNSMGQKPFSDDTFLDDEQEDETLLRTIIEEPRVKYDVEVVTKLIVYGGISKINLVRCTDNRNWMAKC